MHYRLQPDEQMNVHCVDWSLDGLGGRKFTELVSPAEEGTSLRKGALGGAGGAIANNKNVISV